jgi:hypothetical protein
MGEWLTAQRIGELMGFEPPLRHGNQAMGPMSWSGVQSEGFSLASTLRGMVRKGIVAEARDWGNPRPKSVYRLTK